jgi:ribonuclease HI
VYSIFVEEDNIPLKQVDLDDDMWHMHFYGSGSNEGNGDGIILVSPVGKIYNLSYRLEFACTNNVTKFKALLLGIENAYNLGCGHLSVFGDSELVVNMVCKIYSPSSKMMKRYTQTVWALILNLLSFNITHVKGELNSIVDRLVVFAYSPNQRPLPHMPDCSFQSLYHPHIRDDVESWQAIPNDESGFSFIQDEPPKPKEIMSIEDDKIPKGLNPFESLFSLSDVDNKEKKREGESRRKVGETLSLDTGALESSKNVKTSVQCFDKKEMKLAKLIGRFQDVFSWHYEYLRGFDPSLIQHVIPIKEGMKPTRKKQRPINSTFKTTFQRELENFLRVGIIFSVYPEWVSNWVLVLKTTDHIRTSINFRTFSQAIMINPFPPLNMEMFLQQVVGS